MNKQILISQPAGLGDCIFAQAIANRFIGQRYEVIWPVKPHFVDGLRRAYPRITWISDTIVNPELLNLKEDKEVNDIRVFPMRWSDRIVGQDAKYWMKTKFDMAGMEYQYWQNDAGTFKRDGKREIELFYEVYGLQMRERFNLINKTFRQDASRQIDIVVDNGLRNVEMKFVPGYSLFDHALLIERAENIHVVNSSIFYLLEVLDLQAIEVHLYQRTGDEIGFPHTDYLFSKEYILHT